LCITANFECPGTASGQSETPNHVRSDGGFPRKRSPGAGDGCTAGHCQPGLILVAELAPIADAGAGDRGICNGPGADERAAKIASGKAGRIREWFCPFMAWKLATGFVLTAETWLGPERTR
jgi:hypothetical protein